MTAKKKTRREILTDFSEERDSAYDDFWKETTLQRGKCNRRVSLAREKRDKALAELEAGK